MGQPIGLQCIRCGREYLDPPGFKGCPTCLAQGHPANLRVRYDLARVRETLRPHSLTDRPHSIWRYGELMPTDPEHAVTLGEGLTPLVHLERLGSELGMPRLYAKNESANPTWSFKDRLASGAVSWARASGHRVITGSSSGNAGAATAAYAARAGLPCVMFTTRQFPVPMRVGMGVYGTRLVAMPTVQDRWRMVEAFVDRYGWFPVTVFVYPLVGSNYYGISAYGSIAYELVEQLGRAPDAVVMPVGAGDAFSGAWYGFSDYAEMGFIDGTPRMLAAEVFGPLKHALDEGLDRLEEVPWGPTVAVSVGLNASTLQALNVLRDSGGAAATATDQEMLTMQAKLASLEGLYVEASSALSLAALPRLVESGAVDPDATIVAFLTASGLKDPDTTAARLLQETPLAEPTVESVLAALRDEYGFEPDGI